MDLPAPLLRARVGPYNVAFCGRVPGPAGLPADLALGWNRQVHGAAVLSTSQGGRCGDADALWTSTPGLAVVVQTADCVPVLLAGAGQVAAVHAGWRGLAAGVVEAACDALGAVEHAWIGPSIGPCCYEVGPEVAAQFEQASPQVLQVGQGDRSYLDLRLATRARLPVGARVELVDECTRCQPRWWSYRRDRADAGRNFALIWLGGAT